jgi:hypothetical protein
MKMLKKCIIAIAVVALLAGTVQAANAPMKVDGRWPSTYQALDLCLIPVYMDVGYYVELKDCDKKEIKLVQITCPEGKEFPCYRGCVELEVRANFPAIFGGDLRDKHAILDKTGVSFTKDTTYPFGDQIPSDGVFHKIEVCVEAWKTKLWDSGSPDDKLRVATLAITVKPPDDVPSP